MCLHGALCSFPFLFDRQYDYFQKKNVLTFDPNTGVEGVCKDRKCACVCDSF